MPARKSIELASPGETGLVGSIVRALDDGSPTSERSASSPELAVSAALVYAAERAATWQLAHATQTALLGRPSASSTVR